MENSQFWTRISGIFSQPKNFWDSEEYAHDPTIIDRLIYYLINYFDQPSHARRAIRLFLGIDFVNGEPEYCDWHEVRVATLSDLEKTLKLAGCTSNIWELAVTLKDFLQNTWDTIETLDLDAIEELKPGEISAYLKQLRGIPNAWKKNTPSPYRPVISNFYKHCKKYRQSGDPVLPENVIHYLEYLWGRTNKSPFEFHANKLLSRIGFFEERDDLTTKITQFNSLIGEEKPINKHRQIVQFSKTICLVEPRCNICPLSEDCTFNKENKAQ